MEGLLAEQIGVSTLIFLSTEEMFHHTDLLREDDGVVTAIARVFGMWRGRRRLGRVWLVDRHQL